MNLNYAFLMKNIMYPYLWTDTKYIIHIGR